ncbi:MAG TPA: response regulator transcription factor [Candidatus Xenobia bacterium]|nr:response regulator transcription factor [Candidatus Xenobia bacterium]
MPLTAERRARIAVGLLARNPLAVDQLRSFLKGDPAIRVFREDEIAGAGSTNRAVSVAVVDRGSLSEPLGRCLCWIRLRFPSARTLVVGRPQPVEELVSLLVLGVHGFVAYDDAATELRTAVRRLSEGRLWFAAEVLERYVAYTRGVERLKQDGGALLTRRERHILELLHRRLANKEIATILRISENTVKFHLSNIYTKLGVRDRYSVSEFARERLLLDLVAPETG